MAETVRHQTVRSVEFKRLFAFMAEQAKAPSGPAESPLESNYPIASSLDSHVFLGIEGEDSWKCKMQIDGHGQEVDIVGHVNVELSGGGLHQHRLLRDGRVVRIVAFDQSARSPIAYSLNRDGVEQLTARINPENDASSAVA